MGMTIEEAIGIITAKGNYSYTVIENRAKDVLVDTARKYQMMQADYETRLKADMVAMLTDIQLEMESLRFGQPPRKYVVDECLDIIQQKINALKAESEPQESEDNK